MNNQTYWYITDILKSATPLFVGILVAYMARKQWKTNREMAITNHNKLKLDLFDRRFRIYEAVKNLLDQITNDFNPKREVLDAFLHAIDEADFLFNQEIPAYLNDVRVYGSKLRLEWQELEQKRRIREDMDVKLRDEHGEIIKAVMKAREDLKNVFMPYLDFRNVE
jgi:hypothetical protein